MGKGLTGRRSPQRKPHSDVELRGTERPTSLWGIAMTFREKRLRKRVYLKSPVRENRTPGSVGGQPGNRLSYPDERPSKRAEESFASTGYCTLSNVVRQSSRTGQVHTSRSRGRVSRGKETLKLCGHCGGSRFSNKMKSVFFGKRTGRE